MAFQISPGVNTSEIDLTTVVPGVSSVDAGFSGAFRWGPINEVTLVDSEDLLTQRFQKPDANTFVSFFTAANFNDGCPSRSWRWRGLLGSRLC